jgi:hypothetical protein
VFELGFKLGKGVDGAAQALENDGLKVEMALK